MKRASLALALAVFAAGCGSSSTSPSTTPPSNPTFKATLLPASETPPIANAENTSSGTATITFVPTKDANGNVTSVTASVAVTMQGFPAGTTITNAHIHTGATGVSGGILIPFPPGTVTLTNGGGSFNATGTNPSADQFNSISANPAGFYFNVHTALNPGGVMRGQLVKQ